MKKIIIFLMMILVLSGCKEKNTTNIGIDVDSVGSKTPEERESKWEEWIDSKEKEMAEQTSINQE